ncbi:hypothetical protein ACIBF6_36450 [Streptosporangium amethystogenes]|uniref:hypothetical protein n=1 Tax=Streptosporangium amethystogenes TaxID=2002 RepID=UPI0037AD0AB7
MSDLELILRFLVDVAVSMVISTPLGWIWLAAGAVWFLRFLWNSSSGSSSSGGSSSRHDGAGGDFGRHEDSDGFEGGCGSGCGGGD